MRQFVKLSDIQQKFEAIGVGVGGMTYDDVETIKTFHDKWGINYPLVGDIDGAVRRRGMLSQGSRAGPEPCGGAQ